MSILIIDIIACNTNVDCAADDIRGFMDTAGPDHEVWWALQTTAIPENQAAWNQALQLPGFGDSGKPDNAHHNPTPAATGTI